jgi:hypothetical protein
LRYLIGWHREPDALACSDSGGELGERRGDAEPARGVDAEFVMAASETSHAVDLSSCGPLFLGLGGRERGGFVVALTGL